MNESSSVIIAGTGLGGFHVAAALREKGFPGRIVLVGDESELPYDRPPLSKAYLLGDLEESRLTLRPATFFADKHIELLRGRRVVAVDRTHRRVALDDERVLDYGHFVFATGARNRPLPVPGTDLDGVFYLRSLDESRRLRERLGTARRVVVIGAGFIGLEFAMAAVKKGLDVTVIEVAERPMARALSPQMAAIFTREHAAKGVRFLFGTQVMRILGQGGRVRAVEAIDHADVPADLVVIGIGVQPNVEVAAASNLDVRNGIVVDQFLSTSDPHISAVGDCAAHPNPFAGGAMVRLESVQNATDQGRSVALRLMGTASPYAAVPWFWSDQGALRLQIAGLTAGFDHAVLRGDATGTVCAVFCFKQGSLLGVETLNRAGEHLLARKLLAQRVAVTPEQAADESFDLRQLLASAPPPPSRA